MKNNMQKAIPSFVKACAVGVAMSVSAFASAAPVPYSNQGKGGADYTNTLRVYINGVDSGFSGLVNQSSAYGESLNFGTANAGDTIVFAIDVDNIGKTWYSDKSQNIDGVNHVYAAAYEGDELIPVGTYVAFEDLKGYDFPQDFNYLDEQFVIANVTFGSPEVPVPAAAWLFGSGLLGLAGVARRRR
jgi:hypothetical protein